MAFGDPYASPAELSVRLDRDEDPWFPSLLSAATQAVEAFTGRQFNKDTATTPTATARRFRAIDPQRLSVDDFHTTADLAISVDGTAWLVTDVDPRPWNGIYKGMTGWPYSDLLTVSRSWPWSRRGLVTVTAHWGWAAVPKAIKLATLNVAESLSYGSGGGGGGPVRSQTIDGYSVTYATPETDVTVPSELAPAIPYRRMKFGVA